MAATVNMDTYSDALVVLGTAGVVVPLVHRWGLNPIIGYLLGGILLGPLGLGSFVGHLPVLKWLTVTDAQSVSGIADLGIVFLLFLIGVELSYERLMAMRRLVFGLGLSQVVLSSAAIAGAIVAWGNKPAVAIVLGTCLALSSTAIVLEVLSRQTRLSSSAGRASFSVLLAQDLAVVPILMLVTLLGAAPGGSVADALTSAMLQAAVALVTILVLGRLLLRPLFRLVAHAQSSELFIAAILFVVVGTGVVAALAGLSMALGAFVAGLLLAETEYRKAIEATVEPYKGLLLGIFFFTVGMKIDVREVIHQPATLLACVSALIAIKAAILLALCRLFRVSWPAAIETSLLLGPGGEFAFVGIGMATAFGLLSADQSSFALAVTALSMVLIPAISVAARRIVKLVTPPKQTDAELGRRPDARSGHAIVVGHGRVGKVVCAMLDEHEIPHLITDSDAATVSEDRKLGHDVYFGDATKPEFLKACGLMEASGVIITIHTQAAIDEIIRHVRALRPDVLVVSRARDAAHARHLYKVGVSDAVPETIEASLQLSEAALVGLGVAAGPVIASIHGKRDEFRLELQKAAGQSGKPATHAIKPRASGSGA